MRITGSCPSSGPGGRRWSAAVVTGVAGAGLLLSLPPGPAWAQGPSRSAALWRVQEAEDLRGRGPAGLVPLIEGLSHPDSVVRAVAVRGLGRQERPEHARRLIPFLRDSQASVRVAAIEAVMRSLRGWAGQPASARTAEDARLFDTVLAALRSRGESPLSGAETRAAARSIGLLPFWEPRQARAAEAALMTLSADTLPPAVCDPGAASRSALTGLAPREGVAYALYFLARSRRSLGDLSDRSLAWLHRQATHPPCPAMRAAAAPLRRLAWLALGAAGDGDTSLVRAGIGDSDSQVRRLAVAAVPNVADSATRLAVLERARRDPDLMVRLEWVRVYRQGVATGDCRPLLGALRDTSAHVQLAAIDALGGVCPEQQGVVAELGRVILNGPPAGAARLRARGAWHARAHALVSLARVRPQAARPLLRSEVLHPVWQARMYVARAAAIVHDTLTLTRLAQDSVGSVREAAIEGLRAVAGHAAGAVYRRALRSRDYQVVRAAARALAGAAETDTVLSELLDALDRITRERRETSRDPRMELLARLGELGDASLITRLSGYLRDFDPVVADRAAAILTRWSPGGPTYRAAPELQAVDRGPLQTYRARPATRLRVTMAPASGGDTIVLRLHPDHAPAAVARVAWLARRGYYDGLTWHRVVPNFVIQGGSPAMNEYVGDGPFMRDELGGLSHLRGTVGISTRGRDTGDAQWFVNLVDNLRLDPDYTVFATVESGLAVADRILEGDVMARVEVLPPP